MNDIFVILRCFGALSLLLLPAAPVAFSLFRNRFTFSTTLAASVALGPFVVGVEWLVLAWLHVPFRVAVPIMAVAGIAALFCLRGDSFRLNDRDRGSFGISLLAVFLLVLPVVSVLAFVPWMRQYGWHNMMQLAACYQIPNLPRLPEEWDMAGMRLNYPWFGLIHVTALAWMLDVSPTQIFLVLNLTQLLALIWIVRGIQMEFIETATQAGHLLTVVLYFLAIGCAGPLLVILRVSHEARLDPPIGKFLGIDAMNAGFSLAALSILIVIAHIHKPFRSFPIAAAVVFAAVGLVYPLLYPAVGVILFAAFLILLPGQAAFSFLLSAGPGFCLSALLLGFYLKVIGADGSAHVHISAFPEFKQHLFYPLWQLGPWLALILLVRNRPWRSIEARILLVATIILGAAYFIVRMPMGVEYKLIAAAIVCLAPVAAGQLHHFSCSFVEGRSWILAALFLLSGYDYAALYIFQCPQDLHQASPIQEASFWVGSADIQTGDLVQAIGKQTPTETVLLCDWSYAPVSVLTRRAMYVASDPVSGARPGYSMPTESMLMDVKGYRREEFRKRTKVLGLALADNNEVDYLKLTSSLQELGRPVAVVLGSSNHYGLWLRSSQMAQQVFDDGRTGVWLLPATGLAAR